MKKNHKLFGIITLIIFIILLGGCGHKMTLEEAVEKANKDCPVQMGNVMTLENLEIENGNLVVNYAWAPQLYDVLSRNQTTLKTRLTTDLKTNTLEMLKDFDEILKESKASYIFRIKNQETGEHVDVEIPATDI